MKCVNFGSQNDDDSDEGVAMGFFREHVYTLHRVNDLL